MRYAEIIETVGEVPRLWISPTGEIIDCDDPYDSHGGWVISNPNHFGIDLNLTALWQQEDDDDGDGFSVVEFAIALAEGNGWVRVSRDASTHGQGRVAISAASIKNAHRAIRILAGQGYAFTAIDLEIEQVTDATAYQISRTYHRLNGIDAVEAFIRRGAVRR